MRRYILIAALALSMSGCTTLGKPGGFLHRSGQERKLAQAAALLEQGNRSAATDLLAAISVEPGIAGVTDEALFRLSLLRLASGQEKNGNSRVLHDLERLTREYPASPWAPYASGLSEFLAATNDLRQQERKLKELNSSLTRENRELKEQNASLTKENRELSQSIEKLKSLELELGKGNKP